MPHTLWAGVAAARASHTAGAWYTPDTLNGARIVPSAPNTLPALLPPIVHTLAKVVPGGRRAGGAGGGVGVCW